MAFPTTVCYRQNLTALAAFQPPVAARVEAEPVPEGVTPATGRDGTSTFQIPDETGRLLWLGGSSMPSISAVELFTGCEGGGGNLTLPGILTGYEPLVLLQKLQDHEVLFVLEENLLHLKLAMQLYDYADPIAAGRLVFIPIADLAESLRAFFEDHPGYLLPTRLLTVPQRSSAQTADLQRRVEAAGKLVTAVQTRVVESHAGRLRARTFELLPPRPHLAVVSVDAGLVSLEQCRRISRALDRLQWPCELCIPDGPNRCHLSARIGAVDRAHADFVLFVNGGPGAMRSLLPDAMPAASWFLPGGSAGPTAGSELRDSQLVFASTQAVSDALVRTGVDPDFVAICDLAADETIYHPVPDADRDKTASRTRAAVMMNLPDARPEAAGVKLASHVRLWRAMEEAVSRNVDRYRPEIAEELLDAAQRASGTMLQEAAVRGRFISVLRTRLAPAAIARATAKALVDCGFRTGLWGANWPPIRAKGEDPRRGFIPVGAGLNELFNGTDIVVLPEASPMAVQTALDALAAGTRVILRTNVASFQREHPGLDELIPHLCFYATRRELTDTVRRLLSSLDEWSKQVPALRDLIQSRHTVARRLQAIADRLHARSGTRTDNA